MEMEINEKPSLSMNIVNAEDGIGMNVQTGGGGTKDHSKLQNLDYENSGHTGFASKDDVKITINGVTFHTNQAFANFLLESLQSAFNDVWGDLSNKYQKPSSGIPRSDLDTYVQTSLNKADTALQEHQDISGKQNIQENTLTTTNKNIPAAINEVNSIAKGANQALSYANYSSMVTAINALSSTALNVGQNIMIVTVEVPDLWVSGIESTSSTYTYVDDATIINELKTNGYIQVGYYKLSMLETQKVDLTGYQTLIDSSHKLLADLVDDTNQNNKFVTANEKTIWNNAVQPNDLGAVAFSNNYSDLDNKPSALWVRTTLGSSTNLSALLTGIYEIKNIEHTDFPIAGAVYGVLIQYSGEYKPQMFVAGGAGECHCYYRRWLTGTSSWTPWEKSGVTLDNALNSSSTNPVKNSALYKAIVGNEITFQIPVSAWSEPSGNNFYNTIAIVTLPADTFIDNSTLELLNYNGFNYFAKHGFVLYSAEASSQRIWITAHDKPTSDLYLHMRVYNYE